MRQAVEIIVIGARQFAGFVKRLKGSPEKKQATIRKRTKEARLAFSHHMHWTETGRLNM